MRLLIIDHNSEYSKRFKHYIGKKYPHVQIVTCETSEEAKSLLQTEVYDVVLYDVRLGEADANIIEKSSGGASFAYISETNETVNGIDTVFKFQGVTVLYTEICAVYEKRKKRVVKTENPSEPVERKTDIITFFPVHGGAGSSTMAAACAMDFSKEDKVLYINLEQRPSDFVFFDGEIKKGLSDIVSAMKTKYKPEGIKNVLDQVIQKEQKQRIDNLSYIKGYNNIMDCLSMQPQNIEVILRLIKEYFSFRYIIIDAGFVVDAMLQNLIYSSDKLVFVSAGSDLSNMKLFKIQRYLDILKRDEDRTMPISFLLFNQYYGLDDEKTVARDMEVVARFPRFRTGDKTRITTQKIIDEVLDNNGAFSKLK